MAAEERSAAGRISPPLWLLVGLPVGCTLLSLVEARLSAQALDPTSPTHSIPPPMAVVVPSVASPQDLPFAGMSELPVDGLVEQVLARNPSLSQMVAAWQAASARYPQVTSLDDPMFGTMLAPASFGSNNVEAGYRLEISQKYPFPGKLGLRGQGALAEASAAGHDVDDIRLQLIESAKYTV